MILVDRRPKLVSNKYSWSKSNKQTYKQPKPTKQILGFMMDRTKGLKQRSRQSHRTD